MVREGYYFGLPPLFLGIVALVSGWRWGILTGIALVALALFVFYFFRNPERMIPAEPGLVVSPADGRVVVVTQQERAGRPGKRISIFLAIWNVHVNRAPAAGTITNLEYKPGNFWRRGQKRLPWRMSKTSLLWRANTASWSSSRLRAG